MLQYFDNDNIDPVYRKSNESNVFTIHSRPASPQRAEICLPRRSSLNGTITATLDAFREKRASLPRRMLFKSSYGWAGKFTMSFLTSSANGFFYHVKTSASTAVYTAKTIHLFTVDIVQPVIVPWTLVGICSVLAGPAVITIPEPSLLHVAVRTPQAFLWMWLNFLTFAIGNQRLPDAVHEDSINKPWRALPSQRLTMEQAKVLLFVLVPTQFAVGTWLGVSYLTALTLILSYLYNDLGGADLHWTSRNLLNAFAIIVACAGSASIVIDDHGHLQKSPFSDKGHLWAAIQAALIATTIQVQDLRDQEGDKLRGRSTMPLDLGDGLTRWSITIAVILWSWYCPVFWDVDGFSTSLVVLLGTYLVLRVLILKDTASDRTSWKVWGVWSLVVFMLPLYSRLVGQAI